MKFKKIFESVLDAILKEEIEYDSLRNSLQALNSFLQDLTQLDLEDPVNKKDIQFENGKAISSSFAALCLVDVIRTRQFTRGIYKAIKHVQNQQASPVRILYAGTGPYATLILPLLSVFSAKEIQLVLLEVNEKTYSYLNRLIYKLDIESYVEKVICEDASKYKIDITNKVDILISETMQHALVKEQQVPIMLNLVEQLSNDAIIIPSKIQLDLALMNSSTEFIFRENLGSKYSVIKTVMEFDRKFINSYANHLKHRNRFELCKAVQFVKPDDDDYDKLVVLTRIQVYEDEWINYDESSLTIPKNLFALHKIDQTKTKISLDYVVSNIPDFEYELN